MTIRLAGLLILMSAFLVGCARESPPGGPGAKKGNPGTTPATTPDGKGNPGTTPATTNNKGNDSDRTFEVQVEREVNVNQGANKSTRITVDRGDNFTEEVKLSFKAPAGIKITPANPSVKNPEEKVDVVIEAAPDAQVGKHTIVVTGTPQTGAATSIDMTIEVHKKGS